MLFQDSSEPSISTYVFRPTLSCFMFHVFPPFGFQPGQVSNVSLSDQCPSRFSITLQFRCNKSCSRFFKSEVFNVRFHDQISALEILVADVPVDYPIIRTGLDESSRQLQISIGQLRFTRSLLLIFKCFNPCSATCINTAPFLLLMTLIPPMLKLEVSGSLPPHVGSSLAPPCVTRGK